MHLLCGEVDEAAYAASGKPSSVTDRSGLEARIERLEIELQALRGEIEELRQRLP